MATALQSTSSLSDAEIALHVSLTDVELTLDSAPERLSAALANWEACLDSILETPLEV